MGTDEIELIDDAPDDFDPQMTQESFSFFDVLEARTYPKDVKTVYLDESAAYEFGQLSAEVDNTVNPTAKQVKEFEKRAHDLQARLAKSKFTFYLTGVPGDMIESAQTIANEAFEDKKKQRKTATQTIERYLPEDQQLPYMKYLSAVVNSLHIEQILQHSTGRVMTAPSPDEVSHFWDKAPDAAKFELNTAIRKLSVRSADYERALDEGFLAKP